METQHGLNQIMPILARMMLPELFSSPDPKGHMSFYHHFASIVVRRKLLNI
jgi:hypothetical protein